MPMSLGGVSHGLVVKFRPPIRAGPGLRASGGVIGGRNFAPRRLLDPAGAPRQLAIVVPWPPRRCFC